MNRRTFLTSGSATMALAAASGAEARRREKRLGLSIASYKRYQSTVPSERYPGWQNALEVLDHCTELGAGCLQIGVHAWSADFAGQVRKRREKLGIHLEGQIRLPKAEGDRERFAAEARAAREAGATILRTVCLGGRRYESFRSAEDWKSFQEDSWKSLTLAEPMVRDLGLRLAIENHKDWRTGELLDLLGKLDSESVGVTFDFGNNLALLEDPHEVCEALAPFILSTHLKDMAVAPCDSGFLLSEVPLGRGILDLPRLIAICEKANPDVQFNLEMITRDPLEIPVLTDNYWTTMQNVPATDLAWAMRLVRDRAAGDGLPQVSDLGPEERLALEEANVRTCFAYARAELGL